MGEFGSYLLQIVTAAILCSMIITITGKSNFSKSVQFLTGLVMVLIIIKPLANEQFDIDILDALSVSTDASAIIERSKEVADSALTAVITDSVTAYIQDKATAFGAEISVDIDVKDGLPDSVTIIGEISPYARRQLSKWISNELGIPEEEQYWS